MRFLTSCFALLAALLLISGTTACLGKVCDTAGHRPSVVVTVLDEFGEPIGGPSVTFSEGGEPAEPCSGSGPTHLCGLELGGHLTIHVELEGYEPSDTAVHVPGDECHVDTQEIEVQLVPTA